MTTIAVVTAAIRGPSIFSMYVVQSLHNKNFQIEKATPNKLTPRTLYFLLYYFTTPRRRLVAVTVCGFPQVFAGHNLHCSVCR
jgi:hypothetical protein